MGTPKNRTAAFATPLVLVWGLVSGCAGHGGTEPAHTASVRASATPDGTARALARIEHRYHARLGVFMVDTGTGRTVSYRADERFAYCSASKLLTSSLLLKRATGDRLDRVVTYHASDLEDYSPITSKHVGRGMKLRDVIAAALQYSDNTAANLITGRLGGPQAVQAALRGLGDTTTHVDRTEPTLNDATPGDIKDTTTPRALDTDMRRFVLGDALPASQRQLLTNWIVGNTTGGPYIRAGVPFGWMVGDKTGNGGYGTRNDIAVAWPTSGAPIVIAILSDRGSKDASSDDALIADATKTGLAALR